MKPAFDLAGLALCSRYSYPPNSLSLCGPDKKIDLSWYSQTGKSDSGNLEILRQFSTLYPYLRFIAGQNRLNDSFDKKVVEAYWLGNDLLNNIPARQFADFLADDLELKRKLPAKYLHNLLIKLDDMVLPNHVFHVTNIYFRTGHLQIPHTIETMDACIVNWGKIINISSEFLEVKTKPLREIKNQLMFGETIMRKLLFQGEKDQLAVQLKKGDTVSYHWGYFCKKINQRQLDNLRFYTKLALKLANLNN